jgi:hypothetical protein
MGCSHVMGVGINEPDTLSCQLMTQLDQPVVNLGYCGGAAHIIQYNTMRMKELGWRPKSVTIAIPDANRFTYFEQFEVTNFTSGLLNSKNPTGVLKFYEYWTRPPQHAELYSRMAIKGAEAMWLNMGVPVILRHASPVKGASQMAPNWADVIDYARDQQHNGAGQVYGHPGPATQALRARDLATAIHAL